MSTLLKFGAIVIFCFLSHMCGMLDATNTMLKASIGSSPLTSPKAQLPPLYPLTGTQAENGALDSSMYPLTKHEPVNGSDKSKPLAKASLHNGQTTPQLPTPRPSQQLEPEHETAANTEGGK
ncbi:hypothetical protein [Shewanella psychrotolerans]|uniref:hypothetical protein n=1 Tax=Shewanella psychrotolerans TaxID=2864206 RepID=UPI001C65803D|nr:hypothetical protein [Shewanella psychrotolerans]QYK00349.1 hypothetical protein K0I62_13160 [Shewanella psychrotolerans]